MKDYDELVCDLLARRDTYIAAQKRKRKVTVSAAASLCGVCLVALLALEPWGREAGIPTPTGQLPELSAGDTLCPGLLEHSTDEYDETVGAASNANKIIINIIEPRTSTDRMNICLNLNDFVEMSLEEMVKYYGIDYVPEVPADIKLWEDNGLSGIYRRNSGKGEVYWDADILNYSNEDFSRTIHLEVDKGSNVFFDYFYFKGTEERSVINNTEVLIGLSENGCYYAEFMCQNVGFFLDAQGVTEEEFIAVISSIIK